MGRSTGPRFSHNRTSGSILPDITAHVAPPSCHAPVCDPHYLKEWTNGRYRSSHHCNAHAEYLLGEIRDQLLFYYSQDEYDTFLEFFLHLRGKKEKFTYDEYLSAFNEFIAECDSSGKVLHQFFENEAVFRQFLYDQNVICYKERDLDERQNSELFIRWCFRERTLANMAPKVRNWYGVRNFLWLKQSAQRWQAD